METAATETTRFCPMCAAPMRPRASFCHRCGKSFPDELAVVYQPKQPASAETQQLEAPFVEVSSNHNGFAAPAEPVAKEEISIAAEVENPTDFTQTIVEPTDIAVAPVEPETANKQPVSAQPPRKRRVVQTTEYVWEESSSDPTWRLLLATIVILAFLVLILWLGGFVHF